MDPDLPIAPAAVFLVLFPMDIMMLAVAMVVRSDQLRSAKLIPPGLAGWLFRFHVPDEGVSLVCRTRDCCR